MVEILRKMHVSQELIDEAKIAAIMHDVGALQGKPNHAYRSYEYKSKIYKNYVYENGQENADKYAAKPGFSEHELGLAIDLANIWTITTKGEEYAWLSKNAYKYGYIFRYKEEWEDITGYSAESWHIRYVGIETATKVYKKNMSYEEYYIKYIANKISK